MIRVISICVFHNAGRILVSEGIDDAKQMRFARPLGGAIEPGETSKQAVTREIREELGHSVIDLRLLGVLENIFQYQGKPRHEIVFVYDGRLEDASLYGLTELPMIEPGLDVAGKMAIAGFVHKRLSPGTRRFNRTAPSPRRRITSAASIPTMSSPHIIAFMGVAGSGKTSLVRSIAAALGDASAIFADAYRSIAIGWPNYRHLGLNDAQMCQKWFDEGCPPKDYGSWPLLRDHLQQLKSGHPVTMPEKMWPSPGTHGINTKGGEHLIQPATYILLEDTWGLRDEVRSLIDMTIFLSVPVDIAFARRLQRDILQGERILSIVRQYLDVGHRYSLALQRLSSSADHVLDATKPSEQLTSEATRLIHTHFQT